MDARRTELLDINFITCPKLRSRVYALKNISLTCISQYHSSVTIFIICVYGFLLNVNALAYGKAEI